MKFFLKIIIALLCISPCLAQTLTFDNHQLVEMTSQQLSEQYQVYPLSKPYNQGFIKVSESHKLYYAQYGNPNGHPVIHLHGGPGAGTSETISQLFDPEFYRIILFDQRGAGRSIPQGSMIDNTTRLLVDDISTLKEYFKIKTWVVSGGSWGSTLALAYTQANPSHVDGLILRGIFDGSREQYLHLIYGMKKTYPEAWSEFVRYLPEHERGNIIRSYHRRVMDPDPNVHLPAARAFVKYDMICGMMRTDRSLIEKTLKDDNFTLNISRGFMHYAYNDFFLNKLEIRNNMFKIKNIPMMIVQGRYDTLTPAGNAHKLYRQSENASLLFVQDAGHFTTEPGIELGLTAASDKLKEALKANA